MDYSAFELNDEDRSIRNVFFRLQIKCIPYAQRDHPSSIPWTVNLFHSLPRGFKIK